MGTLCCVLINDLKKERKGHIKGRKTVIKNRKKWIKRKRVRNVVKERNVQSDAFVMWTVLQNEWISWLICVFV